MDNTQSIQAIQNQQESSEFSETLKNKLEDEEKTIWKMQFRKPVFGRYGETELYVQTQVLIAKICIVTGWIVPDDESFKTVLYDQLCKKIKEDYYSLNADEVEYAFRKWGTTTEDWGKSFNLNLVDKVLLKYLNYRRDIREFVDKIREEEPAKQLPTIKQPDEYFIEENFQMWKGLKNKFYQFVNHIVYDKLIKQGLIKLSDEDKERIRTAIVHDIQQPTGSNFNELRHRLKEIKQASNNEQHISRLCKKYAVAEFFNKLIEQGKLKVFEDAGLR